MKQEKELQSLYKHSIQQSFSRRAKQYEDWAIPQKQVAKQLVELLDTKSLSANTSSNHSKSRILDAGCGTGFLSRFLLERLQRLLEKQPKSTPLEVWGVDFSSEMLSVYQNLSLKYRLGDLEYLPFFEDKFFTHSLSSFALHWTSLEKSLSELCRISSSFLSLAMPIQESLEGFSNRFPFPSEEKILSLVESLVQKEGFFLLSEIKKQTIPIPYQGLELLRYFHYTGTSFPSQKPGLKPNNQIQNWKEQYKNQKLQYQILYLQLAR